MKQEPGTWGRLNSEESKEKSVIVKKRREAIEHVQKIALEVTEQKAKKKKLLVPDDDSLKEDCVRLRVAYENRCR